MIDLTLATGAFGSEVARYQTLLRATGFAVPDEEVKRGFFGPGTRGAVGAFQAANGLAKTGTIDAPTAAALDGGTTTPAVSSTTSANLPVPSINGPIPEATTIPSSAAPTPPASAQPSLLATTRAPITAFGGSVTQAPPAILGTTQSPSQIPDMLAVAVADADTGPTLADVASIPGAQVSPAFATQLASQGIVTLGDVRRAGSLAKFVGPGDTATVRLIEAQADLARVSVNLAGNSALIAAGYDSTQKIAAASRTTFLLAAA